MGVENSDNVVAVKTVVSFSSTAGDVFPNKMEEDRKSDKNFIYVKLFSFSRFFFSVKDDAIVVPTDTE